MRRIQSLSTFVGFSSDVPPLEDFSELIGQVNKLQTDDSHQSLAIESPSSKPKHEQVKKLPTSSSKVICGSYKTQVTGHYFTNAESTLNIHKS